MRIEDMPMEGCEVTFPWVKDPEGNRTALMRIHKVGENPDSDMAIPLNLETTFGLIGDLAKVYLKLQGE